VTVCCKQTSSVLACNVSGVEEETVSGSGSGSLVGRAPELRHHTDGVHDYGAT